MVVYPIAGRRVRCPVTKRPVPDDGLTVADHDAFWARRLRDQDVTTTAPKASVAAKAPKASAASAAAAPSTEEQGV